MVIKTENMEKVESLFAGWQETLIWSCLQKVMGDIYICSEENPQSAMAVLGDFCFFAGKPEEELVQYKKKGTLPDFLIMIPQNEAWAELILSAYKEKSQRRTRYAIKKEPNVFDQSKLEAAILSLPPEYSAAMMDEGLFYKCRENAWSRDLISQYETYESYQKLGIGALILKDGEPVSGASSYSRYREGIEIEVDTKEEYRRKGLAYACAAKLILECLKRNLYPSWDAQNLWSVSLAEKLGYHYDHDYTAIEVWS